jgi:hypothetical protein
LQRIDFTTQHNQSQNRTTATKIVIFGAIRTFVRFKTRHACGCVYKDSNVSASRNKHLNVYQRRISESTPVSTNISSERTSRFPAPIFYIKELVSRNFFPRLNAVLISYELEIQETEF